MTWLWGGRERTFPRRLVVLRKSFRLGIYSFLDWKYQFWEARPFSLTFSPNWRERSIGGWDGKLFEKFSLELGRKFAWQTEPQNFEYSIMSQWQEIHLFQYHKTKSSLIELWLFAILTILKGLLAERPPRQFEFFADISALFSWLDPLPSDADPLVCHWASIIKRPL